MLVGNSNGSEAEPTTIVVLPTHPMPYADLWCVADGTHVRVEGESTGTSLGPGCSGGPFWVTRAPFRPRGSGARTKLNSCGSKF